MKNGKYRIALDIGGVISKYPAQFRSMAQALQQSGMWEVFVLTDMHDPEMTLKMVHGNGFEFIPPENIINSDYQQHGEGCKMVNIDEYEIDVFLDDFIGYVAHTSAINLLVFPNMYKPYYAPEWKTDGAEGDFGRKAFKR